MRHFKNNMPKMFRVYPEPKSKKFYQVFIFPNRLAMFAYRSELGKIIGLEAASLHTVAECVAYKTKQKKFRNKLGDVLFFHKGFGSGVVAHELCHATFFWFTLHLGKKLSTLAHCKQGERFCLDLGNMVAQFWNHYYKLGFS